MTLNVQFLTISSMIAGGFYLGISLATFRRITSDWKSGIIQLYLLELSFWIVQMLILFYILFLVNSGEIRVYVVLACILGFSIYKVFAEATYLKLLEFIIRLLKGIFYYIWKILFVLIVAPIWMILQFVYKIVIGLIHFLIKVSLSILKVALFPFKSLLLFVFNLLSPNSKKKVYKCLSFCSIMKNTSKKWLKSLISKRR